MFLSSHSHQIFYNLRAHSDRKVGLTAAFQKREYPQHVRLLLSRESFEVTVSGGSTFARVKLKEIDGMAPQDVERAV